MSDHSGAGNVHTRRIAEFVSTLSYERIPAQVIERIKLLILDSLGCAIYGATARMVPHPARRRSKAWMRPAPRRSGARRFGSLRRMPR